MIIQHFCNSFISVSSGEELILCDPWLGLACHGGWHSFPILDPKTISLKLADPALVYISHLHTDHFSPTTLKLLASTNTSFLIKKFPNHKLRNAIRSLGFTKIIELDSFSPTKIGNFEFTIVPQAESNTSGLIDNINFDLDTSLIIREISSNKIFFNKVDNPLSISSLKAVRKFIESKMDSEIDVACVGSGAASEYPQCFPELNRESLCSDYSLVSARRYVESIDALGAGISFPAGGRYAISGRFCSLNRLVAQPTPALINDVYSKLRPKIDSPVVYIEGGGSITVDRNSLEVNPKEFLEWQDQFSRYLSKIPYDYEGFGSYRENMTVINEVFPIARQNLERFLQLKKIESFAHISFKIHESISMDNATPLLDDNSSSVDLEPLGSATNSIEIHLESGALRGILDRRLIMNQIFSGSLTFQIREPEFYDVTSVFALNYLHL
jgi:L-ascorbate metabolism protein UlaG (beta-lactamase superfamily)